MTGTAARTTAILIWSLIGLAGCEEIDGQSAAGDQPPQAAASLGQGEARTETRDVDRPDIFGVTDTGLWDGRPSLGGIWVAHPDVTEPERAKITNTSNGQTVSGALFRRERANPGPRIQVSSDAAIALGMLAGQPSDLTIVAVRVEEIAVEPEALPLAEDSTQAEAVPENDGDEDPDTAEEAAAALAVGTLAEEAEVQPKRNGFWGKFRDSLRNKSASDVAAEADTALIEETTESAAAPEVETAPLDPVASAAAAAITAAEMAKPEPSAAPSVLQNPYIQVGLFSQETNARAAADRLRDAGIVPEIRGQKSGDTTLWRVFIGPVSSAGDQAALLEQVRELGYADAFLAPN